MPARASFPPAIEWALGYHTIFLRILQEQRPQRPQKRGDSSVPSIREEEGWVAELAPSIA